MTKIQRRRIDGILLLDKPVGLSSNQALQKVKWLYRAAKAGHTGTLDPFASGLLPLCLGEATKFSQFLLDADKAYEAEVRLGIRTSSGDREGDILAQRPVEVSERQLRSALHAFLGEIEQIPPMHSALKHHGRPLYEYARQGLEIERKARRVTVHGIDLLSFDGQLCRLRIRCGKGFYVRALADDLGEKLGCGGFLANLRRLASGPFDLANAVSLEALLAMSEAERDPRLLPADAAIDSLPYQMLGAEAAWQISHGQPVWLPQLVIGTVSRLYDQAGQFLGVGEVNADGKLAPKRLLAAQDGA
jgi:tRNA pseudouridine55 synthase